MQDVFDLAGEIGRRLGEIKGVIAVALGGSWARGRAALDADIDLNIYYEDDTRPSIGALRKLAVALNPSVSPEMVTDFWAKGQLLNGGAWLWVEGRRIDWRYQDLDHVRRAVEQTRSGVFACYYQPGFPHGFFSHYIMGEVFYAKPLYDPTGAFEQLKALTEPYPQALRHALIKAFAHEADVALYTAQKAAAHEDVFYATGCIYRCAACLVQVLFAVNQRYITSEHKAIEAVMHLPDRPDHFGEVVTAALAHPGWKADTLQDAIDGLQALVSEIQLHYVKPLGTT